MKFLIHLHFPLGQTNNSSENCKTVIAYSFLKVLGGIINKICPSPSFKGELTMHTQREIVLIFINYWLDCGEKKNLEK